MAKKGKAKAGPVKAEGAVEPATTDVVEEAKPAEDPAVKVAELKKEAAAPKPAKPVEKKPEEQKKEAPKPAQADQKKPSSPKLAQKAPAAKPVQNGNATTTAGETTDAAGTASEAEGAATALKKRRNRRHRKKKSDGQEGQDQTQQQAPTNEQKPKKEHKKKRAKRLRALALAESSATAQIAAAEGAIASAPDAKKQPESVETLQKKIEIAEKVLHQVQQQTQEKPEAPKPASPKQQQKNNQQSKLEQAKAEVKKAAEEKERILAEAKSLISDKVKKQQEVQKLQEEKTKQEEQAKKLREEKDRKLEEAAKLVQQHTRIEKVEQVLEKVEQKKAEQPKQQPQQQQKQRKDSESNKQKKQQQPRDRKESESSKQQPKNDDVVAKSQETVTATKPSSPEKTAPAKPNDLKKAPSPPKTNGGPAQKPAPAKPSKSPEKTLPPKTAPAGPAPAAPLKKAPSPPKQVASRASPKPSTPPTTPKPNKKPELPPKPEFLKRKSPSVEKEKLPTTAQVPASTTPAAPSPVPAPAPAASPVPVPEEPSASNRLSEELNGSAKKPAASNTKAKPQAKKPEVPPKPDIHNKNAAKMKTPIKQPAAAGTKAPSEVNTKFNVEKQLAALNATAAAAKLMPKTLPPCTDTTEEDELEEEFEEEEEQIEYKFAPRPVFLATNCQVCKNPLRNIVQCETCRMVSYCNEDHRRSDLGPHKDLCAVIVELATRRGGHIYNMAHKLTDDEYRNLRVHTLNQSEQMLRRPLQAFEREILLFPRTCSSPSCREWRQNLLSECKDCRQVSFCTDHPDHLPAAHKQWCKSYFLFQKLILRQKILGRIEPVLPVRIASKSFTVPPNIDEVMKLLYKNSTVLRDECAYATLTQIATAPLTALHGYLQTGLKPSSETFTIHLVGAELQFEGDTLDKWEAFFLHIVPEITELRIVFVGPELNVENLPIDIISRI
ncbi:hypothetical protein pipiens_005996, partial [Culex pipiens pipiens]